MKFIKQSLLLLFMSGPAFAEDLISVELKNAIGFGAIMLLLITVLIALLVLLKAFKVMAKIILGPIAYAEMEAEEAAKKAAKRKPRVNIVEKMLSLKPSSEESSLIMAHEYDGIQELDNPTPTWFMGLFYVTIVFGICYILIYHVFGFGQLQYDEYKTEMAAAAREKAAYLAKSANRVDEHTVKLDTDPATLAAGRAVFNQSCVPCHGDHAQGVVGPNLTDDYWLHGGKINDVFKTIKYGVSAQGMPTWEKQLSPKQISDVANYVKSLHGTHPANAKEPQGDKEVGDIIKAGSKTAVVAKMN